ncbi:hypothetical protein AX14_005102 [Amanita brunnescens Koide BX004]|nr:hypothetical protein AX14_005102 [Amanita brunnescens Koide BX004]
MRNRSGAQPPVLPRLYQRPFPCRYVQPARTAAPLIDTSPVATSSPPALPGLYRHLACRHIQPARLAFPLSTPRPSPRPARPLCLASINTSPITTSSPAHPASPRLH